MILLHLQALQISAALCRHFEGYMQRVYLCAGGVPTIGFGSTRWENGQRVWWGDAPISRERAERLLLWHLERRFLPDVLRLCPQLDTAPRLGAVLSWTYNLGPGNLAASTMRRVIAARNWDAVPAQMDRWVYAAGERLPGLVRRRRAEGLVFADHERALQVLPYLRSLQPRRLPEQLLAA
jgi:lysozyme